MNCPNYLLPPQVAKEWGNIHSFLIIVKAALFKVFSFIYSSLFFVAQKVMQSFILWIMYQ